MSAHNTAKCQSFKGQDLLWAIHMYIKMKLGRLACLRKFKAKSAVTLQLCHAYTFIVREFQVDGTVKSVLLSRAELLEHEFGLFAQSARGSEQDATRLLAGTMQHIIINGYSPLGQCQIDGLEVCKYQQK